MSIQVSETIQDQLKLPKNSPYSYEILHFTDSLFTSIKVSYLITMYNSTRRQQYIKQLNEYKPTETVVIIHNPGYLYKTEEWVNNSFLDLLHVNKHIWSLHSENFPRQPTILMEDDIEFVPRIRDNISSIESFLCVILYVFRIFF